MPTVPCRAKTWTRPKSGRLPMTCNCTLDIALHQRHRPCLRPFLRRSMECPSIKAVDWDPVRATEVPWIRGRTMGPLVAPTIDPKVSLRHRITMSRSATSIDGPSCSDTFPWDILHLPVATTATIAIASGSNARHNSRQQQQYGSSWSDTNLSWTKLFDRVQDADYSFFILGLAVEVQ
jgi:hypothetical protein